MLAAQGILVSEVTEVDRRTGRRMGLSPETVNAVINAWADEYIKAEITHARMSAAANPEPAPKAAKAATPRKPRKAPAKRASAKADTADTTTPDEPTEGAASGE